MKTVNMHEAKTRLSELVKAVEERNGVAVLCRNGRAVAEIRGRPARRMSTSGSSSHQDTVPLNRCPTTSGRTI